MVRNQKKDPSKGSFSDYEVEICCGNCGAVLGVTRDHNRGKGDIK